MRITHPRRPRPGRRKQKVKLAPEKPALSFTRASRLSDVADEVFPLEQLESEFPEITDLSKRKYLAAISVMPRLGKAAAMAGVTPKTAWHWRHDADDPLFLEAFQRARQIGAERIESEVVRRGVEGYEKPVWHQGQLVGSEKVYSDSLLLAAARAHMPERYAEQRRVAAPGGGPIQMEERSLTVTITDEELLKRLDGLRTALVTQTPLPDISVSQSESDDPQTRLLKEYEAKLAGRNGNGNNGRHE